MRSPSVYLSLVRHLGLGWVLFRTRHALRRRWGGLRHSTPPVAWNEVPAPPLRLAPAATVRPTEVGNAMAEADDILAGRFRLFSHRVIDAGFPPSWTCNQLSGEQVPADRHWSALGDFAFGDIKGVWELSRFPWAWALVRAHRRSGQARYATAFWDLFADWCAHNPPNQGPNWMCGQEATFRLMAVLFAAENLPIPDAHRALLARFIMVSARRIAANLDYALSQKNNHGVSECVGLVSAALVLPAAPESESWLRRGLAALERQLVELVYEDGGFSQHSLIYHRVLLHDLAWVNHRLLSVEARVPTWLTSAGRRAGDFLVALIEPCSGQGPLYGPNDGANVLPLADADFLDMRPVAQLAGAAFTGGLPFETGPWDEAAGWLVPGWRSLPRKPRALPAQWHAPHAGCAQLRNESGKLFLRCPTRFRHRPAQADMLHVDISLRGQPCVVDGGSFSYNSRERFANLGAASQHNSFTIDAVEPMSKVSPFLYLPWPRGEVKEDEGGFVARHTAYAGMEVEFTRRVAGAPHGFVVEDHVECARGRRLRWHWRLADLPWRLDAESGQVSCTFEGGILRIAWEADVAVDVRLLRADQLTAYGWWSPHYGEVEAACSLLLDLPGSEEMNLRTTFLMD